MPSKYKFNLKNSIKTEYFTWNGWVKNVEDINANINEVNHLLHIWSPKSIPLIITRVAEMIINEWDIK